MESVVYAVDWNQVRENVFGGAAWLGGSGAEVIEQLRKPTAMVCSTRGAEKSPLTGGRKRRDELLLDMIRSAAAKGGTVLIPTDSSSRVLELAYVLEHAWRQIWRKDNREKENDAALRNAKLYLATGNAGATMTYVRSMLEWMDENVVREFETDSTNVAYQQHRRTNSKQISDGDRSNVANPSGPFDFQYLRLVERKSRMDRLMSTKGARVILASDASLDWGFSKETLQRIANDPSNLIILTKDYGNGAQGLGATLWQWYQERRDGIAMEKGLDGQNLDQVYTGGRELSFQIAVRTSLEGRELLMYQQYLATQRRLQNTMPSGGAQPLETAADALDESSSTSSSSSEDSDPERQGKALNTSAVVAHFNRNKLGATKETLGVNVLLRQPGVYDYDVRGKKGREQMFPFLHKRRRADDFGDLINPDDYLRAEERDDIDGQRVRDAEPGKETRLGHKRKWQDSGLQNGTGRRSANGSNKRRQAVKDPRTRPSAAQTNGDTQDYHHQQSSDSDTSSSDSEPDSEEEASTVPSRLDISTHTVQTHLRIAYVDFSGIHDQRSLSMLLPLIRPKKLILIGGSASETSSLADDYRQKLGLQHQNQPTADSGASNFVYTPAVGETVNASVDTNAWTVKLSETLVRRLHWQDVKGMGVVTLVGHLAATTIDDGSQTEVSAKKKQKLLKQESADASIPPSPNPKSNPKTKAEEITPLLDVLPTSMAAATRSVAQPLHVGDLRLADLRKILQSAGHTAEFRGEGTLLIDGLVAVRKSGTGRIEVEGGGLSFPATTTTTRMGEGTFLAVKRRIYEGLAVIAGG